MTIEVINIGAAPDDGTGESLREGGQKINANFSELDTRLASAEADLPTKAPLASPALTGTPTAPTASQAANSTQIATTAFVKAAIAALLNAAPAALDTLDELAQALGDDPNFATTMTNALAGKQPLDATLTALAALSTAANKLIYATGSDAFATTDLTAKARDLLAQVDEAAMRTFLGLVVQTSTTDAVAGRVMLNGAHGVGGSVIATDTNLDNYKTGGFYITPLSGLTNIPSGWDQTRYVLIVAGGSSYATQYLFSAGVQNNRLAHRTWNAATWSPWVEDWHAGNTPKQVSQTDSTQGSMLVMGGSGVGPFGLGDVGIALADVNNLTYSGLGRVTALSTPNAPTLGVGYGIGMPHAAGMSSLGGQLFMNYTTDAGNYMSAPRLFARSKSAASTWAPWIEFWNSSNLVKQASATDTGAGKVMLTGAFGLGNVLIATDMETPSVQPNGLYTTSVGTTTFNPPMGLDGNGVIWNQVRAAAGSSAQAFQIWQHQSTGRVFVRSAYNNVWTLWRELMTSTVPWVEGGAPALNLLTDSGRFAGKINPLLMVLATSWTTHGFFSAYNGASQAEGGKFISNNTTYGGSAGNLNQDTIDLLTAMGKADANNGRYGPEYFITNHTAGSGTVTATSGADSVTRYLALVNNSRAVPGSSGFVTFVGWVRAKSGSAHFTQDFSLMFNGVPQAGNAVLPSNQWVHVRTVLKTYLGYDNAFPRLYASTGAVIQIALPAIFDGICDVGLHKNPIPTLNELSA